MNRLPISPPEGNRPHQLVLRERQMTPSLALPSLPRLTTRLTLTRTDILRRATLDPDWRR